MGSISDPTPIASASLVFDRPLELVVAQFFDIEYAIHAELHPGVTFQHLAPLPGGERPLRQELKYLNRVQIDDFLIERASDGAWVKRFIDGPNVGARFIAHFTQETGERTSVHIDAIVPGGSFISGLGKLSQLGMEKALQKLLAEHQRALAAYAASRPLSRVRSAVASLRDLTSSLASLGEADRRAVSSNLLAAAYVVAVAGGEVDSNEREALKEVAHSLCGVELDASGIEQTVQAVASAVATQGIAARCDKIGGRLAALGVAELGVAVAALVAMASHGIDAAELAAISRIAAAAQVGQGRLEELAARVENALLGR